MADELNLLGGTTDAEKLAAAREADKVGIVDRTKDAFWNGGNIAMNLAGTLAGELLDNDPSFKLEDHYAELTDGIPSEYHREFYGADSMAQAQLIRQQLLDEQGLQQRMQYAGFKGMAAYGLSGLVDVDAPLMLFSGGTYTGGKVATQLGKMGLRSSRLRSLMSTAAAGAEAGLVTGGINAAASPMGDWSDVPGQGLAGIALGGTLGALTKVDHIGNEILAKTHKEFLQAARDIIPKQADEVVPGTGEFSKMSMEYGSVGAAAVPEGSAANAAKARMDAEANMTDDVRKASQAARDYLTQKGVYTQLDEAEGSKAFAAFNKYMNHDLNPFRSDWDALMSGGPISQKLGYDIFESAVGAVRNNKTSAMLDSNYFERIASPVAVNYPKIMQQWSKEAGFNFKERTWSGAGKAAFDREVYEELQYRLHDGVSKPGVNPHVKEMADLIDKSSSIALDVGKGRASEIPIRGFEELTAQPGYFRQKWSGQAMAKAISDKIVTKEGLVAAIKSAYMKVHPGVDPDMMEQWAKAVVRGSLARERELDTNVMNMLDEDGTEFMKQFLIDHHFPKDKVDDFVDMMAKRTADKNKETFAKQRIDIDLREPIPGTNLTVMDLVDQDIHGGWLKYSRNVAGAAALARKDIQKADRKKIIQMIQDEARAMGKPVPLEDNIGHIFSYFDAGPIAGGVNDWVRRAKQATNLALLQGLGITQLAEFGPVIGAVGFDTFRKSLGEELGAMLRKKDSELVEQFKEFGVHPGYEHLLYRDDMAFDMMRNDGAVHGELTQFLDKVLAKGTRLQGYTSMFYQVRALQQRVAVNSILRKLDIMLREDNMTGSLARLYDIGLDEATVDRISSKYFKGGVVENTGSRINFNLHKWEPEDAEEFVLAINRHSYQVVQKALPGESSIWMHKDMGSVLLHLKNFPLLAATKQTLRNLKYMDEVTTGTFLYGLATAGLAYSAKQVAAGNIDKTDDPLEVAKGAFNLSNMTGFIPMWTDPIAAVFGMNDLRFNQYGAQGVGDILSTPAIFPTMNRLMHVPESAVKLATGTYDANDLYALKATPIVGNAAGFSAILNAMRDDLDAEKDKARREKQKAAQPKAQPKKDKPKPAKPEGQDAEDTIDKLLYTGAGE